MGGSWRKTQTGVVITPISVTEESVRLDFHESGSTARFLLPVAAALYKECECIGRGRLNKRPFAEIVREMRLRGVSVDNDFLPIKTNGILNGGNFEISGSISSQYTTGLLFALPIAGGGKITLTSPMQSAAYVDMTLDTMAEFGINAVRTEDGFIVHEQRYISPQKTIAEGDWSNSAFWIAADKLCGGVTVCGLNKKSRQGDKAVADILDKTEIDCSQIPDLAPILAVLAASRKGKTIIGNASRLRLKESDRIKSVCAMINSLGGDARETEDSIIICGNGELRGGEVDSFADHRIAMAAAIASCICTDEVIIHGAEAVNKSYPTFFEDFKSLGGSADVQYR